MSKCQGLILQGILLIAFLPVFSQNYSPFKDDESRLTAWQKTLKECHFRDSVSINGEYKKQIRKEYRDRYDFINDLFVEKQAVSDSEVDGYLQEIVRHIVSANPLLQNLKPRFYFSRSCVPNAFSCGEGSIFFNFGLFSMLDNESQVAFILCHELAHYYLDHSNKTILEKIELLNSKDLKKELKSISKTGYGQNKRFGELVTSMIFRNSRHSRTQESSADSLGLIFLSNTKFDCKEALVAFDRMDSSDVEHVNMEAILKKWFSFSEYPFRDSWIKKENAFFGGPEKRLTDAQKDSMKTHPACPARKKALEPFVLKLNAQGSKFVVSEQRFKELTLRSRYDIVENLLKDEYLSASLYYGLMLLEENPTDSWLIGTIGECLNQMYAHQKAHTLGKVVSLPNPAGSKEYNILLQMIQKARLEDFAALSYYFMLHNKGNSNNDRLNSAFTTSSNNIK